MTSQSFCYWLQGFFEISDTTELTPSQVVKIKQHLNLVFKHEIDPAMGNEQHQAELNQIHNGVKPMTELEAIIKFGPKPSPEHQFNFHGWFHPAHGQPRC